MLPISKINQLELDTEQGIKLEYTVGLNKWTIHDYAQWYLEQGFSIIPIKPRTKEPLISWKEYQIRKPTLDEIGTWFYGKTPNEVSIGIVCGSVSGNLTVLDFDNIEIWNQINPTYFESEYLIVKTGSGKRHLYIYSKTPIKKSRITSISLDVQGEGGYVVAPPSIHPCGEPYTFIDINKSIQVVENAFEVAKEFANDLGFSQETNLTTKNIIQNNLPEIRPCIQLMIYGNSPSAIGNKNHGLNHNARMAVANEGFAIGLDDIETAELFKNQVDYSLKDSIYQVQSLRETWIGKPYSCRKIRENGWCLGEKCKLFSKSDEKTEDERTSHAKQILELTKESDAFSFIDQNNLRFLRFKEGSIWKHYPLEAQITYSWLANLLYQNTGEVPKREAIKNAIAILYAQAQATQINLSLRVAQGSEGSIWIDMCDDKWRAIHVTKNGWTIKENPPTLFKRFDHNSPLPEPSTSGKLQDLAKLTTIKNPIDKLLFIIHTLSYWIPDIPHPIMNGYGPQGSCKTSSQIVAKAHIDPSNAETLSLPENQAELILQLDQNYFVIYDNVSRITEERSDDFCKAVSGIGIQKRKLFTDSDSIVRTYRRCIAINGIETTANRSDLLERSILYEHRTPSEEERITDAEFKRILQESRSKTIGAMLDILVSTLNAKESIVMKRKPRMADFAEWGCAICESLGFPKDIFLDAYENARIENSITVIEASTLARTLLEFLAQKCDYENIRIGDELWQGNASSLYNELHTFAEENGRNIVYSDFPKNANSFSKSLGRFEPDLLKLGVRIHRPARTGKLRRLQFIKTPLTEKMELDVIISAIERWLNDDSDESDSHITSKPQSKRRGEEGDRGLLLTLPSQPSLMSQTQLPTILFT